MKLRPLALVTALSLGRLLADDATDFPPTLPGGELLLPAQTLSLRQHSP